MTADGSTEFSAAEWLHQARFDLDTARLLLRGGRRSYASFFAHLAVEKALKGCYRHTHDRRPPISHNLRHLAAQSGLPLTDDHLALVRRLNTVSILNLYPDRGFASAPPPPEDVDDRASILLDATEAFLDWIGEQHAKGAAGPASAKG